MYVHDDVLSARRRTGADRGNGAGRGGRGRWTSGCHRSVYRRTIVTVARGDESRQTDNKGGTAHDWETPFANWIRSFLVRQNVDVVSKEILGVVFRLDRSQ